MTPEDYPLNGTIGVLLYTYNRTDDARINMEIIREAWSLHPLFQSIAIIHAYNGDFDWWPNTYLEDYLVRIPNHGHYAGAATLIDAGIEAITAFFPHLEFVIVLAADTWCINIDYIAKILTSMDANGKYLATCAWGTELASNIFRIGGAIDIFILNVHWASTFSFFPLRYIEFKNNYGDLILYRDETIKLERLFMVRFKQAIERSERIPTENLLERASYERIHHMRDREPIHEVESDRWKRRMYFPEIGIVTHHYPEPKRIILQTAGIPLGANGEKLAMAGDLAYYNRGQTRLSYRNGDKVFNVTD